MTYVQNPAIDTADLPYFRHLGPLAADKYAYTMAAALFEAERKGAARGLFAGETTFQMFVRQLPKTGMGDSRSAYLMTAGALPLAEWLGGWRFSRKDIAVLGEEVTPAGTRLFGDEFLQLLGRDSLQLEIDAMRDGELAYEREPMLRVKGPLYQCLMVEAMILGLYNSCSNFATLASQAVAAAQGRPVYEYGMRRGPDIGGLGASYATYIGGTSGTSNMLARKHFGIPASGTMAHALVMLAKDELEAFGTWVQGMPDVAVFLVDTYDTLEGVRNAIKTCQQHGVALNGIRLDSGDLAYFSREARKLLDAAGYSDARIFASNDLDPAKIDNLLQQKAPIDFFAVGTWLSAAMANPALGGVYKLAQAFDANGLPRDVMKFSEEQGKATLPGTLDALRMQNGQGMWAGDVIVPFAEDLGLDRTTREIISVDPKNPQRSRIFPAHTPVYHPVQPFWRDGGPVYDHMDIGVGRTRGQINLQKLEAEHRRLVNPHRYVAGVEQGLYTRFTGELTRNNQLRQNRSLTL